MQKYVLKLYITGATHRSTRAIMNIRRICDDHLKDRYELEIIDIFRHPVLARGEQIVAASTLIKKPPLPPAASSVTWGHGADPGRTGFEAEVMSLGVRNIP